MEFINRLFSVKHFDKVLLVVLFIIMAWLCIHLMNKADAGNDEATFLTWAENNASLVLGALLGLIKAESGISTDSTVTDRSGTTVISTMKKETS